MQIFSNPTRRSFVGTLGTALLLLIALEIRFPYYFLQDDSLEYYLPVYVHNWRSLIHGELPLYNFHTFAGVPHASMGQPGVFYIPQYVAMFISQLFWGHPFATIDLLGIFSALLAVAGSYLLLKELGASDTAATFAGLTALSGYFLWLGRMWISTTMFCAWFPWIIWATLRYLAKPSWNRAMCILFLRLALLYVGHSQYFVLAMLFEHAFALIWLATGRPAGARATSFKYLALNLPTVALGLPLFVPLAAEVHRSLLRATPLSYGEFSFLRSSPLAWIAGQLFVFLSYPRESNIFMRTQPYLSYVGYAPALLVAGIPGIWRKQPKLRPFLIGSVLCLVIALLWSWNVMGDVIYRVPVLNRFRYPFKLVYFAGFFECMLAALVFDALTSRMRRLLLAGVILNWAWIFLLLPSHAWRIREYHPPLKSPWRNLLADGRYFVISDNPVLDPEGTNGSDEYVELNYSVLWGLDNLLGYEPMHSRLGGSIALGDIHTGVYSGSASALPMDHLRRWSVKYVLLSPTRNSFAPKLAAAGFTQRVIRNGWSMWENPLALPRVRWEGSSPEANTANGIDWTEHVNSIEVRLNRWQASKLEFAFAANPDLQVCLEDSCKPLPTSPDGLIHIDVPAGTKRVRIVYRNRLFLPSILLALLTASVLGACALKFRRAHNRCISKPVPDAVPTAV